VGDHRELLCPFFTFLKRACPSFPVQLYPAVLKFLHTPSPIISQITTLGPLSITLNGSGKRDKLNLKKHNIKSESLTSLMKLCDYLYLVEYLIDI
jgi:hypothetical protein